MKQDRIKRALMELMKTGPDRCTRCARPFDDWGLTYGGLTPDGAVHLVSDCCVGDLADVLLGGLYFASQDELNAVILKYGGLPHRRWG